MVTGLINTRPNVRTSGFDDSGPGWGNCGFSQYWSYEGGMCILVF